MIIFIIDIFCKDTVIGLCQFEDIKRRKLYKNNYSPLFKKSREQKVKYNPRFIDPIACHL